MSGDFSSSDVKTSGQYYSVSFKGKTSAVQKTVTITFQTTYSFAATANTNGSAYGTATATVANASITTTETSASTTATFTATPKTGYEFVGWGTSSSATTYESSSNPYTLTLNGVAGSTASKTLYAIFRPVFNFTATANKINGSYGTVTKSVTAKILGNPGETSKSTQVTFTATPNTNCTFEGWYYDAAHTNLASTDATYTPTITNTTVGSTANLTLYAWFKSNQTIIWTNTYEKNIVNGMTAAGAATATASSGLTVTYSSSDNNIASVSANGDVTGVSASVEDVTITVQQAGNDEFNPASATRDFHIINKYEATFTVSGFTSMNPTIHVDDTPTITLANTTSDFTYISSDPEVLAIARNGNVITLTALKVGTSTVTLNQPENATHSAVNATYNITVAKVPNTLDVTLDALSQHVDGTISVTFAGQNNTVTALVGTITDQVLSSGITNGGNVITYANGVITACNAGTAKITFTQAATEKYESFTSSTYEITVTKIPNPITITLAGGSATNIKLKYGDTAALTYTSVNTTSTPSVNRKDGHYTTYANGTVTARSVQGTDIYEITQAETYKYEAGYAAFTIRVNNSDEATMYVLNDATEYSHGTGSGVVHTYSLSGPGETLYYSASRGSAVTIYYNMYVEWSDDNSTWHEADNNTSLDPGYKDFTCAIPENARYVRFRFPAGGTLVKYIKNVRVPRKTYLRASSDKEALGTVYTGSTQTSTFTVDYSTTNGGNINVSSNNAHFTPSASELTTTENSDGTKTFTVTYTPDPEQLGDESAVITIADLFYSQQITLTATAAKKANTLDVIGEQNLKVDDEIGSVYLSMNSNAPLNYNLSREGVITYDPTSNRLRAVGAGSVTLTFTQPENDYYLGTSKSVSVSVTKYDQTISWDNELTGDDRTLDVGDVVTTNTATSSSALAVTYSSSNTTALEVDATTGTLTAKAGGSNIAITATQAGNYKYNEASVTRYFTIISKQEAVVTTSLTESVTNILPIGSPDITIRCNATLSSGALTVSDPNKVSVTFGSNTFTLHPLAEGVVTVTLMRPEDEGYFAVSKKYTIEVIKPVLVLDPTEQPVISYSDYSTVTLSRTLKAGYSTIALPFNTTVEAIVGATYNSDADWVAQLQTVTHNAQDGFTLYFQKVDGGTIEANEPYVLHLGAPVDNPQWTDIAVSNTVASTHAATKGYEQCTQWVMHANYQAAFDMEGSYGIVNTEGALKLGGSGSTLNAFTAYITSPAVNAGVKLRSAFVGDDGVVTFVEGLPLDAPLPESGLGLVYGLDGRRRPSMSKGINILRSADGRTRKVLR